jgi:hypothetical protein
MPFVQIASYFIVKPKPNQMMKKVTALLAGLALSSSAALQAQTFIPPAIAEIISVPSSAGIVNRIQHTSCYTSANVSFAGTPNNLYLYSWNAPWAGTTFAGIGWCRRNTTDATVIQQGYMPLASDIADLEVGFIVVRSDVYIVSTYYKFSTGRHMMDIYRWDAATLTPFSMGNILSTSTYGRISLDVHDLNTVAITWNDASGLHVKIVSGGAVLTVGGTITITNVPANSVIPDIAMSHPTGSSVMVRIAFVNEANGDIHVMRKDLPSILASGATTTFVSEDINAAAYPGVTPVQFEYTPNNLNLDCPDHYSTDNWSYVYSPINTLIRARTRTVSFSATPFNMNLNTGLTGVSNFHPTIAYDRNGQTINYGWFTDYGNRGYVAVERTETGGFVTPSGTYKVVSNYTAFMPGINTATPVMSFSKQNDNSSKLYAVYPILPANALAIDLRTKLVPWTATTFSAVVPGHIAALTQEEREAVISPNPFTGSIALRIAGDRGDDIYSVTLTDISGKAVHQLSGNLNKVNSSLSVVSNRLSKGIYLVNVSFLATGNTRTFKIVKE